MLGLQKLIHNHFFSSYELSVQELYVGFSLFLLTELDML